MTDARTPPTLQRFEALLELHGAALERWPEAEQQAARLLLASDAEARTLLADAARLDALLSALTAAEPSAALRRVVAEIPLRHPQRANTLLGSTPAWFPFRSFGRAALVATIVLVLGALASLYTDDEIVADTGATDELGELAVLAFADDLDEELEP